MPRALTDAAWARCKGCRVQRQIAGELRGRPILSFLFNVLDFVELSRNGWTYDGGAWWCRYCTRRRNLMRSVPRGKKPIVDVEAPASSNVTDPSPPSGEKM